MICGIIIPDQWDANGKVIAGYFLDSAKASLRARLSAHMQPVDDPGALGGE